MPPAEQHTVDQQECWDNTILLLGEDKMADDL